VPQRQDCPGPPVQLIPKSNATAGPLAHIAVSKFADGLTLYRQQKIFDRLGIEISRAATAKWLIQAARCCALLIALLRQEIRSGPLINIDESPLQVLNEAGRRNTSKSYMWVYRGGGPDRPVLLYQYHCYVEDGRLRPDNILVENAIRPFVVGRKNWLFAGSPEGAAASATFFSLIETAKANGLEPYGYLRHIFKQLPLVQTEQDLRDLLPHNIHPDDIALTAQD